MRLVSLAFLLLLATNAAAQPVPDTLWAPADSIIAYGWSVDAEGDRVLIGGRVWPPPAFAQSNPKGVVFVYRRATDGSWEVEGRLEPDYVGVQDCFSWTLDLRGERAVIGASCEYGLNPDGELRHGAVYVFHFDGQEWIREAKLYPSDVSDSWLPDDHFGWSVSLEDDCLVVGVPYVVNPELPDTDWDSGAAYVFELQSEVWAHTSTLLNEDTEGVQNEWFGTSVTLQGDEVLVGADGEGPKTSRRGAVYVFQKEDSGWVQRQKFLAPMPSAGEGFGWLVAADGGRGVVASRDAVYPLERDAGTWQVGARLTGDEFDPTGVARYGDHLLTVDATFDGAGGMLFTAQGSDWKPTALPITPPDPVWSYELVSLSERYAFIGHPSYEEDGYVLVYDLAQGVESEAPAGDDSGLALSVAPNPVADRAEIRFTLRRASPVRLTAYDVLGREVLRLVDEVRPGGTHRIALDVEGLAPGVYVLRLQVGREPVTERFTVAR